MSRIQIEIRSAVEFVRHDAEVIIVINPYSEKHRKAEQRVVVSGLDTVDEAHDTADKFAEQLADKCFSFLKEQIASLKKAQP